MRSSFHLIPLVQTFPSKPVRAGLEEAGYTVLLPTSISSLVWVLPWTQGWIGWLWRSRDSSREDAFLRVRWISLRPL